MGALTSMWEKLKDKFWFLPASLAIAAFGLSLVSIWIDSMYANEIRQTVPGLFVGMPDAARSLLSTIASATITVVIRR